MTEFSYKSGQRTFLYKSVVDVFIEKAEKNPNKEICIHRFPNGLRRPITYSELRYQAENVANFLVSVGVKVGNSVGIIGPNTIEWIIGEIAILMTGAVSVHLVKHGSFKEIIKSLRASDCKAALFDPDGNSDLIEDFKSFRTKSTAGNTKDDSTPVIFLLQRCVGCNAEDVETLRFKKPKDKVQLPSRILPESTAVVLMTSGSTGDAKMIEHSHFGLVNTASSFMLSRGLDEADSGGAMYNDRPFSWVGGSVIYGLLNGDTRVFRDGRLTMKKDGVFGLWKAVVEEKCTNGFFMPSTILDLIENIEEITKSKYRLKAILTGGQMISAQIVDVRKKLCKTVVSLYGLTEISVVTSIELDPSTLPGTLGSLFEGVEVKIVDSDSNTLPRQQLGEICFKCPWMLKGYRKASTKRRNAISDGWMNTGDIGIIDIEGNLVIKGKAESVIKRHTLKILSGDVEECIATLPGVKRVVIIAVPDARSNEEVCACVVLDQSSGITMDEVKTHCKEKLGDNITGYAPTYYLQFQVIPMLGTGKPDRMKIKHDALELINQKQCV